MKGRTALGEAILTHWRENCPQMVRDLEEQNRLDQTVFEAQERTGDLLYELVSVQQDELPGGVGAGDAGMGAASRARTTRRQPVPHPGHRGPGHRAGSGARVAAARLPDNRGAPDRAGQPAGKGPRQYRRHPHAQADRSRKPRGDAKPKKPSLARYTGWGALANVFHPYPPQRMAGDRPRRCANYLTTEEYESARASTPNAHFTSPVVIQALWQAMRALRACGAGAQILEPSMGVGHFFGLMPESLLPGSRRTGVELDAITARIAKQLYPDATIFAKGFEETPLPDNYFDAVIGNIPFGDYPVHDPAYRNSPVDARDSRLLLRQVARQAAPGRRHGAHHQPLHDGQAGLDDPAVSRRTRRSARRDPPAQHRVQGQCRNRSHDRHSVPAKARARSAAARAKRGGTWRRSTRRTAPIAVNEYFARHPEMMLGEMRLEGTMYRGARADARRASSRRSVWHSAVASLPRRHLRPEGCRRRPARRRRQQRCRIDGTASRTALTPSATACSSIRSGDSFETANLSGSRPHARIRGMMAVRDAVRAGLQTQLDDAPEERITEARQLLNDIYDSFVCRYGPLSSRENIRAFAGDPDQPLLLSLENYDPETKRATKTAIFERRTLERYQPVEHVETAAEALAISLNETGEIDWPRMEQLTGRTAQALAARTGQPGLPQPGGRDWETADRYLSGDVRAQARDGRGRRRARSRPTRAISRRLKAVQPADLQPGDIEARLGSSWIPASDIREFVAELLDIAPRNVRVGHAGAIATWTLELDGAREIQRRQHHDPRHGALPRLRPHRGRAQRPHADHLRRARGRIARRQPAGNHRRARGAAAAQGPLQRMDMGGRRPRAARLARDYNDRFNNLRLRTFDGSHLTLPGHEPRASARRRPRHAPERRRLAHRCKAATRCWRTVVGAGKTWTMAAAAMEMRRLGLAKKPMIVVPNHLVEQWGAAFLKLYPQAQALRRRQGAFRRRQPAESHGAHRHRQLRRRDRLAPLVRIPAGFR